MAKSFAELNQEYHTAIVNVPSQLCEENLLQVIY